MQEVRVEYTCDMPKHHDKPVVAKHEEMRVQIGGVAVDLDLCDPCAHALINFSRDYLDSGRPVPKAELRRVQRARALARSRSRPGEIREWANAHGWSLSNRGRVPQEAVEAYEKATG